jgi:porin
MRRSGRRSAARVLAAAAVAAAAWRLPARAAEADPPLVLELRNTAEVWRNLQGGLSVGDATLDKVQASLRFDGDSVGWPGFSAYAQVFKTNAGALSANRTGDVQTASNIEAPGLGRLFELWAAQAFGQEDKPGYAAARIGVIDLNRTFDSIETSGLFVNSSHGIGPDLSRSSANGPSIFPTTGPAAQADWRPADRLLIHAGVFGVPDPAGLYRFVDLKVPGQPGAVVIAQADYALAKDAQASLGLWRSASEQPSLADPTRRVTPRPGVYGFIEGPTPLPGAPRGWLRAGAADPRIQSVAGYLGFGLVWKGLAPARADDEFGLAVARAEIGSPARKTFGLPLAETTFEATYSLRLNRFLHLQPDVQHIVHPAGAPGLHDATAVGLRLVAFARVPGGGD